MGSALGSEQKDLRWERRQRRGLQPCAAVKQEQLPPGESRSSGGGGGGLNRFFSNVTGFPFPIGPNFVRRTIRYEVKHPPPTSPNSWASLQEFTSTPEYANGCSSYPPIYSWNGPAKILSLN